MLRVRQTVLWGWTRKSLLRSIGREKRRDLRVNFLPTPPLWMAPPYPAVMHVRAGDRRAQQVAAMPYPSYQTLDSSSLFAPTVAPTADWTQWTASDFAVRAYVEEPPNEIFPACDTASSGYTIPDLYSPPPSSVPFHVQLYQNLPQWIDQHYRSDLAQLDQQHPGRLSQSPSKLFLELYNNYQTQVTMNSLGGNAAWHVDVIIPAVKNGALLSGLPDPAMEVKSKSASPWKVCREEGAFNVKMDIAVKKGENVVTAVEVKHLGSGEALMRNLVELASREGGTYLDGVTDADSVKAALKKLSIFLSDESLYPSATSPPRIAFICDGFYSVILLLYRPNYPNAPSIESDRLPAFLISPLLPFTSQAPSLLTLIASTFLSPTTLPPLPPDVTVPNSPYLPRKRGGKDIEEEEKEGKSEGNDSFGAKRGSNFSSGGGAGTTRGFSGSGVKDANGREGCEAASALEGQEDAGGRMKEYASEGNIFKYLWNQRLQVDYGTSKTFLHQLLPQPSSPPTNSPPPHPAINNVPHSKVILEPTSTFYTERAAISAGYYGDMKLALKEGLGDEGRLMVEKEAWWQGVLREKMIAPRFVGLYIIEGKSGKGLGRVIVSEWCGERHYWFST